ncbi:phage tail tape measure protein [Pseudomonas sp. RTCS2]|uniref:phage tail tape measure protein n=1 Tax=Pseudomonas sp. RTCS2 TaxID=3389877 RepID=UPI0039E4A15C
MANDLKMEVVLQAIDRATRPIRAITQGSVGLGQALKQSRDKLKQLQATQADVSSFRQAKAASLEQAAAMKASRDRVSQLSAALMAHEKTVRPLQTSYDQLMGETTALRSRQKELSQQVRQTRESAQAATQVWKNNTARIRELRSQIASSAQPTQKLRNEYDALVTKQQAQLETVRRLTVVQKDLQQQHRATADSARQQRERMSELAGQLQEARAPMQGLNQDYRTAVREAQALKAKHSAQAQTLQGLRDKLRAAGISTKSLSDGERQLRQSIASTTQAMGEQEARLKRLAAQQRQMAAAKQSFEKSQALAGSMAAGGAAGLASGYAMSRPLQGMVDAFAPAEDAATQLKVSMMDGTGQVSEDFKKISDLATSLGDRLPGTTADFQNMMTMLRRQGLSAQSILGGTGEAAAYLGVQLKMPVEEAAEFAAKMQDATRTSEKDMMALMDTIQRGFYNGVDPTNMLQGFSKIAPVMDIIKKSGIDAAKELGPLLVMMDQAGMEGGAAGNAYRKIFQAGLDKGGVDDVNKNAALSQRGIQLNFTNKDGNFAGLENLYAQIEKLKVLNDEDRTSVIKGLFGDDSETMTVLNTMMNKGLAGYQEVQQKLQNQADLRARVNEQLSTLSNTIEAAQGSWTNAMAEIGATIAPQLKELINGIGGVAVKVKEWVSANPALTAAIFKTAAGLAILLAAGGGISIMLASMLGPFAMVRYAMTLLGIKSLGAVTAFKALGTALLWVGKAVLFIGRALLMNPIGLAVAAIAGAAYLIYTNWEPVKAFFLGLWTQIQAGFSSGLTGILSLITNFSPIGMFYSAFAAVMNYFGVELPSQFTSFGGMLIDGLVNGITSKLGAVKTAITGAGESTIGWFKEKLGIHSPSRVFAELGGFTMAGLEQGLTGNQGGPLGAVNSLSKQLTDAGAFAIGASAQGIAMDNRPPLSPRPGGGQAAGASAQAAPVVFNIYPAAGMDEQALARLVAAEVAKIQRTNQARSRSALSDGE